METKIEQVYWQGSSKCNCENEMFLQMGTFVNRFTSYIFETKSINQLVNARLLINGVPCFKPFCYFLQRNGFLILKELFGLL